MLWTQEGRFDTNKARPTTRLGGIDYATVGEIVQMPAPFRRAAEPETLISSRLDPAQDKQRCRSLRAVYVSQDRLVK